MSHGRFRLTAAGWLTDSLSGEIGTGYLFANGWIGALALGLEAGEDTRYGTARLSVSKTF